VGRRERCKGQGGEMSQIICAHMNKWININNKNIYIYIYIKVHVLIPFPRNSLLRPNANFISYTKWKSLLWFKGIIIDKKASIFSFQEKTMKAIMTSFFLGKNK
jgi:hypothetical protein